MAEGTSVGSLYYDLNIDDSKLKPQLDSADKSLQKLGDSSATTRQRVSNDLNNVAKGFALAGAGLTLISKNATDFTVNLVKNSKALGREIGTTTEEASRLTAGLSRMGISTEQSAMMFGIFSKKIVASTDSSEANRLATEKLHLQIDDTKKSITATADEIKKHGDKSGDLNAELKILNNTLASQNDALSQNADGFAKLGINTKDSTGKQKDFNTLLFDVADKFKAMPDGIDKTALSMELFGRQGKDLIKVLNLGGSGITDLEKQADKLGLTLDAKTIGSVSKYIESQKTLKQSTDAVKIAIGTATAPALTSFNTMLANTEQHLLSTDGFVKTATVSFLAFSGPVFAGAAAMLSLTANMVQAWPAISAVGSAIFSLTALSIAGWAAAVTADLFLVVKAAQAVTQAFSDINDAKIAQANLDATNTQTQRDLLNLVKTGTPKQKAAANKALAGGYGNLTVDKSQVAGGNFLSHLFGFASGTRYAPGGLAWVGEQGPEIVNLPRGSQVTPANQSKTMAKAMGNTYVSIGNVYDKSDADYILRRVDRSIQRISMGVSP